MLLKLLALFSGHLTAASDVYSFGVVLLELLTGRRSVDKSRPSREQSLVDWARPLLKEPRRLSRVMDPRLEGQYCELGAQKAGALAYQCLGYKQKSRPTMSEVVKILEPLKDFDGSAVEPFVYNVPMENDLQKGNHKEGETRKGLKCPKRNHHKNHHLHQVHVQWSKSPKSPVSYSENDLHKKLKKMG